MGAVAFLAVGLGAALGAWLRWGLGVAFNTLVPTLPLGTLAANLAGAYLIGMAVEYFLQHALVPAEWRLFVITGLLGGLTTFSTFSAESMQLIELQRYGWALLHAAAHLAGSLVMTALGLATMRWLAA